MKFNEHYNLEGRHAFLGASKYSWLNYSDEKLVEAYTSEMAKERGTRLHALAAQLISEKIKVRASNMTFYKYVNDAIGFGMTPEQPLYFSENCFGTADAISFSKNELRIHDLKTGVTPAHMEQLYIYDALFCLEYKIKPGEIKIVNRIYQSDNIFEDEPTAEIILPIMDKIKWFDKIIAKYKEEQG